MPRVKGLDMAIMMKVVLSASTQITMTITSMVFIFSRNEMCKIIETHENLNFRDKIPARCARNSSQIVEVISSNTSWYDESPNLHKDGTIPWMASKIIMSCMVPIFTQVTLKVMLYMLHNHSQIKLFNEPHDDVTDNVFLDDKNYGQNLFSMP